MFTTNADRGVEGTTLKRSGRRVRVRAAATRSPSLAIDLKTLHAKIGELTLENDFLEAALSKAGLLSAKR